MKIWAFSCFFHHWCFCSSGGYPTCTAVTDTHGAGDCSRPWMSSAHPALPRNQAAACLAGLCTVLGSMLASCCIRGALLSQLRGLCSSSSCPKYPQEGADTTARQEHALWVHQPWVTGTHCADSTSSLPQPAAQNKRLGTYLRLDNHIVMLPPVVSSAEASCTRDNIFQFKSLWLVFLPRKFNEILKPCKLSLSLKP